jgi:hypothetical protein
MGAGVACGCDRPCGGPRALTAWRLSRRRRRAPWRAPSRSGAR